MKPKNKLQREVLKLSQSLPELNDYQRKDAIKKVAPHIALSEEVERLHIGFLKHINDGSVLTLNVLSSVVPGIGFLIIAIAGIGIVIWSFVMNIMVTQ